MKKIFIYLAVEMIIFAVVSCKSGTGRKGTEPPLIKTVVVGCGDSIEKAEYAGVINSEKEIALSFKVNGQLELLPEHEGIHVRKGAVIATLDKHDFKVHYDAAHAVYGHSEKEIERIRILHEANTVSPNDYEKAVAANKVAEAKYNAAKDALMYTELKAPFDGFVSSIYKNEGENVSAGVPVLCIKTDSKYDVDINMTIKDYGRLESLLYAELVAGNSTVRVKLRSKNRSAASGQLCDVSFEIPEEYSSRLMNGMNVSVVLAFSKSDVLLSVPSTALFHKEGSACVWKIDQGKAFCVPLKICRVEKDRTFVSGLRSGDKIAVTGIHSLSEGQSIEEMKESSSTNVGGML